MYKCKEIIELASQSMDTSLPWYTRMEIKAHLLMCHTCRRYAQQLQFMHKVLGAFDSHALTENCQLSDKAKQRIAKKMHQAKETAKQ